MVLAFAAPALAQPGSRDDGRLEGEQPRQVHCAVDGDRGAREAAERALDGRAPVAADPLDRPNRPPSRRLRDHDREPSHRKTGTR